MPIGIDDLKSTYSIFVIGFDVEIVIVRVNASINGDESISGFAGYVGFFGASVCRGGGHAAPECDGDERHHFRPCSHANIPQPS